MNRVRVRVRVREGCHESRELGFGDDDSVSFDVYLQDFSDAPADRSASVGTSLLAPMLDATGENVVTADGGAAVYGADEVPLYGLMFNHVEGDLVWDVIYAAAVAGDWVVMPVDGPLSIVDERQVDYIPDELRELGVTLVRSGRELRVAATLDAETL